MPRGGLCLDELDKLDKVGKVDKLSADGCLISVIVPVYNAERYLARCVESILAQTHGELELILVDDGSTDGSGALCDGFAMRDGRVRVVHKANGGVSAARNDGIEAARGEWIAFCDNDDFYAPTMLERLLEMCLAGDCAMAQCRPARGTACSLSTPLPQPVKILTSREMLESFYTEASIYIWDKLYHRSVWNTVRFPAGSYTGEDLAVVHLLIEAAGGVGSGRIATTNEQLYYHFRNPGSVMGRGFDVRWATGALTARLEFARDRGLVRLAADTAAKRVYEERFLLTMNRRHNRDAASRAAFAAEHKQLLRRYYRDAKATKGLSARDRLIIAVCRFAPIVYHAYNYLKFRVIRRDRTVKYGEIK